MPSSEIPPVCRADGSLLERSLFVSFSCTVVKSRCTCHSEAGSNAEANRNFFALSLSART